MEEAAARMPQVDRMSQQGSNLGALMLWVLIVASAIPMGGTGSSAGPHIVGVSLPPVWSVASIWSPVTSRWLLHRCCAP